MLTILKGEEVMEPGENKIIIIHDLLLFNVTIF